MFKLLIVGCVVAFVGAKMEEDLLPERKNVLNLFDSKKVDRRLLGKSSSSSGDKWTTDNNYDDDGVCGCTAYLDDSSSSSSWSSGKKTSTSSGKSRRRLSSPNTWNRSGNKWTTDTSSGTTHAPFDSFCDCLCACDGGNSVTYNQGGDRRRSRTRRLGSSSKWSSDYGCGSSSSSGGSGKKSSSSSSSSGKSNRRRIGSSSKWNTDETEAPCPITTEVFSTTKLTCQCLTTTTQEPSSSPTNKPTTSPSDKPTVSPSDKPTLSPTTQEPTNSPSERPTNSPTERPTSSPSERPTNSPSDRPTMSPLDETCPENSDYFILSPGWEMYLASYDRSIDLSGRYDQNGAQFEHSSKNFTIWFEQVDNDYVLVVGDQDDMDFQLLYKDYVSTWTDNDNPLLDSDDENEWDASNELTEFVTNDMNLYDCNGNNKGTDKDAYTQYYSYIYSSLQNSDPQTISNVSSAKPYTNVTILTIVMIINVVIINVAMLS